jgi:hypothetical protein
MRFLAIRLFVHNFAVAYAAEHLALHLLPYHSISLFLMLQLKGMDTFTANKYPHNYDLTLKVK